MRRALHGVGARRGRPGDRRDTAQGFPPRAAHRGVRLIRLGQRAHLPRPADPASHGRGGARTSSPNASASSSAGLPAPRLRRSPSGPQQRRGRQGGPSRAGIRAFCGEGEASARTASAGRARCGAGPGGGSRRRTTPGGDRGRSATVIGGASRGSRSRHPIWLTKTAGLRRFYRPSGSP